ncbi:hypothetical protein GC163_07620 [bacterium]|nr:hypothetical protein [bacterium]
MLRVSVLCFFASYVLAFGLEWTRLVSRHVFWRWIALTAGAAGLLAQTLYLVVRSQQTDLPPLLSSMQDWLLVLSWLVVVVHLFITIADRELALGFIVWPLALALIGAAQFASPTAGAGVNAHHNWTMLHVASLVLGIVGIVVGFVVSLLYMWQHRRLKHRISATSGMELPSLERLARVNRWSLLIAVPLLTFGMISGVGLALVRNPNISRRSVWLDPLVLVSGVCWVIMAGLFFWLLSRKQNPGKQMAWLTAWACGFLLFTTVGAQILSQAISAPAIHGSAHGVEQTTEGAVR